MSGNIPFTKDLWVKALCAWNNVPYNNDSIKKYTDENWGKTSQEGWKRVTAVIEQHVRENLE